MIDINKGFLPNVAAGFVGGMAAGIPGVIGLGQGIIETGMRYTTTGDSLKESFAKGFDNKFLRAANYIDLGIREVMNVPYTDDTASQLGTIVGNVIPVPIAVLGKVPQIFKGIKTVINSTPKGELLYNQLAPIIGHVATAGTPLIANPTPKNMIGQMAFGLTFDQGIRGAVGERTIYDNITDAPIKIHSDSEVPSNQKMYSSWMDEYIPPAIIYSGVMAAMGTSYGRRLKALQASNTSQKLIDIEDAPTDVKMETLLTDKKALSDWIYENNFTQAGLYRIDTSRIAANLLSTGDNKFTGRRFENTGDAFINKMDVIAKSYDGEEVYKNFVKYIDLTREMSHRLRATAVNDLNLFELYKTNDVPNYKRTRFLKIKAGIEEDIKVNTIPDTEAHLRLDKEYVSKLAEERIRYLATEGSLDEIKDTYDNITNLSAKYKYDIMGYKEEGEWLTNKKLFAERSELKKKEGIVELSKEYTDIINQITTLHKDLGIIDDVTYKKWVKRSTLDETHTYFPGNMKVENETLWEKGYRDIGLTYAKGEFASFGGLEARSHIPFSGIEFPLDPMQVLTDYYVRGVKNAFRQARLNFFVDNNRNLVEPLLEELKPTTATNVLVDNIAKRLKSIPEEDLSSPQTSFLRAHRESTFNIDDHLLTKHKNGKISYYMTNPMIKTLINEDIEPTTLYRRSVSKLKRTAQYWTTGVPFLFSPVTAIRSAMDAYVYSATATHEAKKFLYNMTVNNPKAFEGVNKKEIIDKINISFTPKSFYQGFKDSYTYRKALYELNELKVASAKAAYGDETTLISTMFDGLDEKAREATGVVLRKKLNENFAGVVDYIAGESGADVIRHNINDPTKIIIQTPAGFKAMKMGDLRTRKGQEYINKIVPSANLKRIGKMIRITDMAIRESSNIGFLNESRSAGRAANELFDAMSTKGHKIAKEKGLYNLDGLPRSEILTEALFSNLLQEALMPTTKTKPITKGLGKLSKYMYDNSMYYSIIASSVHRQFKNLGLIDASKRVKGLVEEGNRLGWENMFARQGERAPLMAMNLLGKESKEWAKQYGRTYEKIFYMVVVPTISEYLFNTYNKEKEDNYKKISVANRVAFMTIPLTEDYSHVIKVPVEQNYMTMRATIFTLLDTFLAGEETFSATIGMEDREYKQSLAETVSPLKAGLLKQFAIDAPMDIEILMSALNKELRLDPVNIAQGKMITERYGAAKSGGDEYLNGGSQYTDGIISQRISNLLETIGGYTMGTILQGIEQAHVDAAIDGSIGMVDAAEVIFDRTTEFTKFMHTTPLFGIDKYGAYTELAEQTRDVDKLITAISTSASTLVNPTTQNVRQKIDVVGELRDVDDLILRTIAFASLSPKRLKQTDVLSNYALQYGLPPEIPEDLRETLYGTIKEYKTIKSHIAATYNNRKSIMSSARIDIETIYDSQTGTDKLVGRDIDYYDRKDIKQNINLELQALYKEKHKKAIVLQDLIGEVLNRPVNIFKPYSIFNPVQQMQNR